MSVRVSKTQNLSTHALAQLVRSFGRLTGHHVARGIASKGGGLSEELTLGHDRAPRRGDVSGLKKKFSAELIQLIGDRGPQLFYSPSKQSSSPRLVFGVFYGEDRSADRALRDELFGNIERALRRDDA
ncbi:hypothetical protein CYMTET_8676 [Cymbomonas tetramitiformis]|uniref:Uncharacterized protein n=1 Tax=Cymbomonas tetramitiformis TaxID=36881 RepID=A0AAE0GSJ2_9CHLO|nr:hypothetical protein CYMTET_8676 [Cymbomonas tetramitiformis]